MKKFLDSDATLKQITITILAAFWGLWTLLVLSGDLINGLQVLGWVSSDVYFNSHNFDLVVKSLAHFTSDYSLLIAAFSLILLSYGINVMLFAYAFYHYKANQNFCRYALWALLYGAFVEMAFILFDEINIQYDLEHGHMDRLTLRLISLATMFVIKNKY